MFLSYIKVLKHFHRSKRVETLLCSWAIYHSLAFADYDLTETKIWKATQFLENPVFENGRAADNVFMSQFISGAIGLSQQSIG